MNGKHAFVIVIILCAAFASSPGAGRDMDALAGGQTGDAALLQRLSDLEGRVTTLERQGPTRSGTVIGRNGVVALQPGETNGVDYSKEISDLQNTVKALEQRNYELSAALTEQTVKLIALQTQFANHVHALNVPHLVPVTILNCGDYGQPCTNATHAPTIEVMVDASLVNPQANAQTQLSTSPPTVPPQH